MAHLLTRNLPTLPLAIASALCLSIAPGSPAAAQSGDLPDTARVQLLLRDGQWIDGRMDTLDAGSCTVFRADAGVQAKASEIVRGTIVAATIASMTATITTSMIENPRRRKRAKPRPSGRGSSAWTCAARSLTRSSVAAQPRFFPWLMSVSSPSPPGVPSLP